MKWLQEIIFLWDWKLKWKHRAQADALLEGELTRTTGCSKSIWERSSDYIEEHADVYAMAPPHTHLPSWSKLPQASKAESLCFTVNITLFSNIIECMLLRGRLSPLCRFCEKISINALQPFPLQGLNGVRVWELSRTLSIGVFWFFYILGFKFTKIQPQILRTSSVIECQVFLQTIDPCSNSYGAMQTQHSGSEGGHIQVGFFPCSSMTGIEKVVMEHII